MWKPRLRLRSMMILVALTAVALATSPFLKDFLPAFRTDRWSAGKDVPLRIAVVDDSTGLPIADASVRIVHPYRPDLIPPRTLATGRDGRVDSIVVVHARGEAFAIILPWEPSRPIILGSTERLSFSGGSIRVGAGGYEPAEEELVEDDVGPMMTVRLRSSRPK